MKTRWILLSIFYSQNHAITKDLQLFFAIETSEYKNNTTSLPVLLSLTNIKLTPCVHANIFIHNKMKTDILMQIMFFKPFDKTKSKPSKFDIGIGIKQDISNWFSLQVFLVLPPHPSLSFSITKNVFEEFDIGATATLATKQKELLTESTPQKIDTPEIIQAPIKQSTKGELELTPIQLKEENLPQKSIPRYMQGTASSRAKTLNNPNNAQNLNSTPKAKSNNTSQNYLTPTESSSRRQSIYSNNTQSLSIPRTLTIRQSIFSTPSTPKNKDIIPQTTHSRTQSTTSVISNRSNRLNTLSPRKREPVTPRSHPLTNNQSFSSLTSLNNNSSFYSCTPSHRSTDSQAHFSEGTTSQSVSTLNNSFRRSISRHRSNSHSNLPPLSPTNSIGRGSHKSSSAYSDYLNQQLESLEQQRQDMRTPSTDNISVSSLTASSPANTNKTHISESLNYIPVHSYSHQNQSNLHHLQRKNNNESPLQNAIKIVKNRYTRKKTLKDEDLIDALLIYLKLKPNNFNYTCDQNNTYRSRYTLKELAVFRKAEISKLKRDLNCLDEYYNQTSVTHIKNIMELLTIDLIEQKEKTDWTFTLSKKMQEDLLQNTSKKNIQTWRKILEYLEIHKNFHKALNTKK